MHCAFAMYTLAIVSLPARAADLFEIYRLAQSNDPTFEAARYAFAAAQQKVPQARAGLLPVINLNGSDTQNNASHRGSKTVVDDNNFAGCTKNFWPAPAHMLLLM